MTLDLAAVDSAGASAHDARGAIPLLETKLYVPRKRSGLVSRPRLIECLRQGAELKLTVVTAPAGFGKTTLLAEWLAKAAGSERAAGWVSLDASDNDSTLFWAYVIGALRTVHPAVGKKALSVLHSRGTPSMDAVLTALINDIHAIDADCVLVLDDYHVIDDSAVHDTLAFLLDHAPPRLHVVLASRSEPPLPLARFRARGELTEVRVADMRFTQDEASAFLRQTMALDVSASDVAKLERRTEGWIAGLKLAALSLKGRADVPAFVEAFSGDNRHVADYLIEEVLHAQPDRTRRFLLATAILERLSGPLCDAVTGEPGSQAVLENLERSNLFVVPLDDRREWYRYHHLFADVLAAHAIREDPDRVRTSHRRASAWYEHSGAQSNAVHHALSAEDFERAAGLLERAWPSRDKSHESARWLARVKSLPDALVRARPVLNTGYAWALLNSGELEDAASRIHDVERWLDAAGDKGPEPSGSSGGMVVVDEERLRTLPAELAAARVYLAQARGDTVDTVEDARRSLDLIPEADYTARSTGIALLALALWARGDLEPAHQMFVDALASMRRGGRPMDAIRGIFVLGDIRVAQGRLHEAAAIYERGLKEAAEQNLPATAETDELYLGLSELHREWGHLDTAVSLLGTVTESAGRVAHSGNRQRWCTAMAGVRLARGDVAGALALLEEAEGLQIRDPLPRVHPVAAVKARIWIAQGRLAEAMGWARERGVSVTEDLTYIREFEHLTLARVLIARRAVDASDRTFNEGGLGLLERLVTEAERGGRTGSVIEGLALQALGSQAAGNARGALDLLERALTLGAPEGYLRVFVDEGVRMRDLLRQAAARGVGGEHTRRVLSGFDEPARADATSARSGGRSIPSLTSRELEVLRLIAAGLRNQEIASQLSISAATVKRHIANAYTKLGAGHRTEALARAKELSLL